MRSSKEVIVLFLLVLPICIALDPDEGIVDNSFNDFDNDGMPDSWELLNGLRYDVVDSHEDPDNDGLSNLEEYLLKTDPHSSDTDGDSISDYKEYKKGTDPLSKERIVWPLIVFPILIILGVFVLFLFEKYHLDLVIIEKWKEYKTKKKPVVEKKMVNVQRPSIHFKNLSEIYREKEEKKKQKEKFLGALSVFNGARSEEADFFRKKLAKNKENEIPQQVEGLMSTLDTEPKSLINQRKIFDVKKKSSLENLKKIYRDKKTNKYDKQNSVFDKLRGIK
jgi:hypothetical protein